ncbi:erythroferrone isoform X7 [Rissa tridactyla]|uniref:erythroferrone isoform X7 n=1 Tax=Rissa tridactyla TaxID=75485 RepID=UPI0023BA5DAC|nr:erythroferrone isoform X7 [Rissa tridactyla]
MRLPELCLALLCAAAGTGSPGSARDQPPGAAGGRAEGAGRGVPGAAAPRVGGVDPRHAWMLLAGSPGRARGSRARGRTGTVRDGTGAGTAQAALKVGVPGPASVPPGTLAVLEELLRELQLLLKAGEGGDVPPWLGAEPDQWAVHSPHRRVLRLHRYTAPRAQRAAEEVAAVQGESSAGAGLRAVPLPAQQQSGDCVLAGEWRWPFHYLRHRSPLPAGQRELVSERKDALFPPAEWVSSSSTLAGTRPLQLLPR